MTLKKPLVTISIPTLNSEKYLDLCLSAINSQTYKNIEINIIDGGSTDRTIKVAKSYGVKTIVTCKESLLKSRYEGVKKANGEYILLLDSDQLLHQTAVERAVYMIMKNNLGMLILEEDTYNPSTWVEKLFQQDRKLVHKIKDYDPYTSVMLPRFYQKRILAKAFSNIPDEVLKDVGGQDHAIIYFEAWQHTHRIDLLDDALDHIEPKTIIAIFKKFYRWGYTSQAAHHPRYEELLKRKERFRKGMFAKGTYISSLASVVLLFLKGFPYFYGKLRSKRSNNA